MSTTEETAASAAPDGGGITPGPALQPPPPAVPTPAPQPQPSQPEPRTGAFDKVLSALGGGDRAQYSVDPNTGKMNVTRVQQSRGDLAKHIIAGALTGLFAGAAEHGPGAVGRAGAEGFQAVAGAEQKRDQQARQQAETDFDSQQKALTRQAQLTNFNFQQQIALRNESRLDAEQQEKFATDQNAITEHMDTIGGQRVPVMVNGKDVNAGDVPNNDKDLMQAYVDGQIKAPQGAHLILSTSSDKDGSIIHHVWTVPNAQLDTPIPVLPQIKEHFHLPDDVAPMGMSRQLGIISEITKQQNDAQKIKTDQATAKSEQAKNYAQAAEATAVATKSNEEVAQLRSIPQADTFGNAVGGPGVDIKEYRKRYDGFSKEYVAPLVTLQKTNDEFTRIMGDPHMTGAEKVTGLLGAVGISFDPLKGKGARINNDIINEHAGARNIWESAAQKANTVFGSGGPITEKQVHDYAQIAQGVVHDAYLAAARESERQGLPVDFLPKGKGRTADNDTLKLYLDVAGGDQQKAIQALKAAGWQ